VYILFSLFPFFVYMAVLSLVSEADRLMMFSPSFAPPEVIEDGLMFIKWYRYPAGAMIDFLVPQSLSSFVLYLFSFCLPL